MLWWGIPIHHFDASLCILYVPQMTNMETKLLRIVVTAAMLLAMNGHILYGGIFRTCKKQ
ncbi:MAG: hypothetical protein ACLRZ2_06670 [Veillonella sp.]